jgi:hypothetical protein
MALIGILPPFSILLQENIVEEIFHHHGLAKPEGTLWQENNRGVSL